MHLNRPTLNLNVAETVSGIPAEPNVAPGERDRHASREKGVEIR